MHEKVTEYLQKVAHLIQKNKKTIQDQIQSLNKMFFLIL